MCEITNCDGYGMPVSCWDCRVAAAGLPRPLFANTRKLAAYIIRRIKEWRSRRRPGGYIYPGEIEITIEVANNTGEDFEKIAAALETVNYSSARIADAELTAARVAASKMGFSEPGSFTTLEPGWNFKALATPAANCRNCGAAPSTAGPTCAYCGTHN